VAFYGYCGPTSILFILKTAREELRRRIMNHSPRGEAGESGIKNGNKRNDGEKIKRFKKEEIKEWVKRKKIFSILLHIPTLNELGDHLRTSEKLGTQPEDMVRFLKRTGFSVRVREDAEWGDLKKALNNDKMILVDWWTDIGDPGEDLGHYSVVTRISAKTLTIYDPDINRKRVLGKNTFVSRWHDVRSDGTNMVGWMAEIKI